MRLLKNPLDRIIHFVYSIKDKNLDWQSANQEQLLQLLHARIRAKKTLEAELTIKSTQLEHDIAMLKTQQSTELAMLKTRCKEDISDYQQYLESLNKLKKTIQNSYPHLPEAIVLTIHHHAKSLLNRMWEADNLDDKIDYEAQLLTFMTTFHEEAQLMRSGTHQEILPENTLKLISPRK